MIGLWKYGPLMLSLCVIGPAAVTEAQAQTPRGNLGTLTCTLAEDGETQKMPPSEERAMRCVFKPTESGVELTYSGTIRQVGAGRELTGKLVMIWVVQGPKDIKLDPGLFAQTYVGGGDIGGADKGAAANSLVGESNRDITMHAETTPGAPSAGRSIMTMELKVQSVPV
ncbi:MAG: DUF992 domain-containing protein [Hyphomicrobiaceae bacterium]